MKKYNYIYLTKNIINGMIYIGQHTTDNLNDGYLGTGKLMLRAIKKYGPENFTKEYLAFCDTKEKLDYLEKFYIKKYNSLNREIGYNLANGGASGMSGYKHSDISIQHMKDSKKDIGKGENNGFYGKHHTDEVKERISKSLKINPPTRFSGHKHTEEEKRKISETLRKFYENRKAAKNRENI